MSSIAAALLSETVVVLYLILMVKLIESGGAFADFLLRIVL